MCCPTLAITSLVFYADYELGLKRTTALLRLSAQELIFGYRRTSESTL